MLPGGIRPAFVQLVKNCLHNSPSRRPIAEQLITSLEAMKGDIDGPYGELATVDAVRWVRMMKALKAKKNVEIKQLQEQVEVRVASTPGSLSYAEREPGTHCLRTRHNFQKSWEFEYHRKLVRICHVH